MNTYSDHTTRPLTLKYVFALGLLAVLAITNFLLLRTEILSAQSMTVILNASSHQRLLLHRTVWLAEQLVRNVDTSARPNLRRNLASTIEPLEETHFDLMPHDSLTRRTTARVRSIYNDVPWLLDSEMRNYILHLRAITTASDDELRYNNPHFEYLQNPHTINKLTGGLDAVVDVYAQQSAAKTFQVRLLAAWSLASTLVLLLLDGWFVFRPMVQRVRADVKNLNELNATLDRRVMERTAEAERRAQQLAQSEWALRDSEALYRSLVDNLPMCVLRKDTTGHFTFANDRFCQLVEMPLEQIVGCTDKDLYPPQLAAKYRGDDERVMTRERVLHDIERHRTPGGRDLFAEVVKTVLRDAEDNVIGTQTVFWDVTDQRRAEDRARHAERLAAIGQMVAGVAHESRNALQQIQACSRMLEWELNGDEPKRELITDMQTAQDRLQRLFNDLRGYASPARLHVRPCNIRTLLTQAWDSIQPLHQGRAASLQDVSSASSTEWVADPFQLEQVFRNILENALAACDDPVQITVDCHVEHVGDRATLRIVVRDNGPGLTLDQQERLFEPFFTTKTHGTGLGMAIVRQIIDAHSGTVAARCGDSAGTEILIKFPYVNWGSTEFTEMTEICHA